MKNRKFILGTVILSLVSGFAYADVKNEVFLANPSFNGISYKATTPGYPGVTTAPNGEVVSQFKLSNKGVCVGSSSNVTYPITVTSANGQNLCTFNLALTISNSRPPVAPDVKKATVGSCDTSGSTVKGQIQYVQSYSNGTTDYCSTIKWQGINSNENGQVMIIISSK